MADDIRQWLDQIRQLQEQLSERQQERDRAYESAANWQRLYETEAQQRRHETQMAQEKIAELQGRVKSLEKPIAQLSGDATSVTVEEEVAQLASVEEAREKLVEAIMERDRLSQIVLSLSQALQTEQAQHAQTRQNLTSALGDAMDRLNRERQANEYK